jgi:hypothetical protein
MSATGTTRKPAGNGALPRPLQFSIDSGNSSAPERYGNLYWAIGLPDGREVFLMADRLEVTAAGALLAWQDTKPITGSTDYEREPLETPQLTLALAPACWVHCYAASVLSGDPIAITGLSAPERS